MSNGVPRRPFSFASVGNARSSIHGENAIFCGLPSGPFFASSGGLSQTLALPPLKVSAR